MSAPGGRKPWLAPLAGVIAALAFAECSLRFIATGATAEGIPRNETYRQYSEGMATSHFLPDSSRYTGNAPLRGAPTILILGDSHVPAVQVADRETMGSVLERMARSQHIPLNVKQIGWSGAGYGIARTLGLGPQLVGSIAPQRVAVVLSEGALRTYPSDPASARRLMSEPPPALRNLDTAQLIARQIAHHSVLAHLVYARLREIQAAHAGAGVSDDSASNCIAAAGDERARVVQQLRDVFGASLFILYAPEVGLASSATPDCWESLLLHQCDELGVQCMSLRDSMLEAVRSHVLVRGFHNTPLGVGHLNAQGHNLAARALFEKLVTPLTGSQR